MIRTTRRQGRGPAAASSRVSKVESLEGRRLFATFVWDGGGANANWTTAANWVGDVAPAGDGSDSLEFPAIAAQKLNNNNFPDGTGFNIIRFTGNGYALAGNPITLLDNVNAAEIAGSSRFEIPATIGAGQSTTWGYIANGNSTINVHGPVDNAGNLLTFSGAGVTRVFGGITGAGGITKNGSGDVLISGLSDYTGPTTLTEGALYLNNANLEWTPGPVTATGGVLRGSGVMGSVSITGTAKFIPGATAFSTASVVTGDVALGAGGQLLLNLNGAEPGSAYDQLDVVGAVTIDPTALLRLTPGGSIGLGDQFTVIANDGADAVAGTFAGLAEGGRVSEAGITFEITYAGGDGNDVVLTAVVANNPPVNTVPVGQATPEETALVFSVANGNAISVADPDAGTAPIQLSLDVDSGTVTLASTTGLTFTTGDGTGDAAMVFTGTLDAINAALDGLTFTPASSFAGDVVLTVVSDDLGNTGPGGAQTDTDTVAITVTDPNVAPPVAPAIAATREIGQNATIDALAVASDPQSRPLTLSIAESPVSGTATVDDAGTPSDPSDDLLTYEAAPGFNGDDAFTYRVTAAGGATATGTVTVTTNSGVGVDQDPDDPTTSALFIVGSDVSERFKVVKKKGLLRVTVNGVPDTDLYTFPTGSIVVIGKGGDDTFNAGPLKRAPQRLYGGDGNDTLVGGRFDRRFVGGQFADVLIGGAGDDKIKGGGSNDFVVGGDGADRVNGGGGNDLLAAGGGSITAYTYPNVVAIRQLLAAWTGAADYAAGVTAVTVTGVGTTNTTLGSTTLVDDASQDKLSGLAGNDLFFANTTGGTIADRLPEKRAAEQVIDLE